MFKWINTEEIQNKHNGTGKSINAIAIVNKMNADYIATRPRSRPW